MQADRAGPEERGRGAQEQGDMVRKALHGPLLTQGVLAEREMGCPRSQMAGHPPSVQTCTEDTLCSGPELVPRHLVMVKQREQVCEETRGTDSAPITGV